MRTEMRTKMGRKLLLSTLALMVCIGLMAGPAMAKMKINVGSTFGPGAPVFKGQLKFKELLEKRSNGEIEVLIHPLGAMGGERDVFQAMSNGGLEMGAMGSGDISIFFPKYLVFEVPYVLRDYDHFWKFWNGPVGKLINDVPLKEKGVMTVGIVYRGARNLTANRPIKTPADVKGLKLRLPEIKPWMKVWESLGAQPTPIPFQEVYMSLKTGVVEAQENPPESIWSLKFYEAQKYMMMTEHIYSACKYQISMKWFDTIDKKTQDLILECWKDATKYANDMALAADKEFTERLQSEGGMTIVEVDKEAFAKAVQPAMDWLDKNMFVPGLLEKVRNIK